MNLSFIRYERYLIFFATLQMAKKSLEEEFDHLDFESLEKNLNEF